MPDNISQNLSEFLLETEPFIEQLDGLSFDTAAELYDLIDEAAKAASLYIKEIDPELRVELCSRQDVILERIIDFNPSYGNCNKYKKIYTPRINFSARWLNVELMKDNGVAGYLLAKEIDAVPVVHFGTKPEDYPYLSILPGMEMIYDDSEPGIREPYINHLNTYYDDMDVILLHGIYVDALFYLNRYRELRPNGKVYCPLDMNSYWMETIPWSSVEVIRFMNQCDIVSTSCRSQRDALNRSSDVYFPCRWITNGLYNPTDTPIIADPYEKENIILTVGRIGTHQKNNEEMLEAFALASNTLSGWTLCLAGPIEPGFHDYIEKYFMIHPELKERVILTGAIVDKTELYSEYKKAKVFAFSSRLEGGTPNAYAEALYHGCMFVTSDVDGADDMTNYGELGEVYTRGDVVGLANAFISVCSNADISTFKEHIPKALAYAEKYYDWNRIAKKLAYMLFR